MILFYVNNPEVKNGMKDIEYPRCGNDVRDSPERREPVLHGVFPEQHEFVNTETGPSVLDRDAPVFSFCGDDLAHDLLKPDRVRVDLVVVVSPGDHAVTSDLYNAVDYLNRPEGVRVYNDIPYANFSTISVGIGFQPVPRFEGGVHAGAGACAVFGFDGFHC